eukprot:XP_001697727.1 predicted protein [Chlamydomonas reinhardtii]
MATLRPLYATAYRNYTAAPCRRPRLYESFYRYAGGLDDPTPRLVQPALRRAHEVMDLAALEAALEWRAIPGCRRVRRADGLAWRGGYQGLQGREVHDLMGPAQSRRHQAGPFIYYR